MQKTYDWLCMYPDPNDPRLGVRLGSHITANDGDVGLAAVMEELLSTYKDPFCIDIGADEGWWSLFCRHVSPSSEILAFEPNPHTFPTLQAHTEGKSITLVNKAVSDKEGTLHFYFDGPISHSRVSEQTAKSNIPIECIPFTPYVKSKHNILLKIDTEGSELVILRSILTMLHKFQAIIFEYTLYWYDNKEEAFNILATLQKEFHYMYIIHRRGFPSVHEVPNTPEELNKLFSILQTNTIQVDIVVSRTYLHDVPKQQLY